MIAYQTPDRSRLYLWDAGVAIVLEGSDEEQTALEAALRRPAQAIESVELEPGAAVVERIVDLEPGSADHARAVLRNLGASVLIVDDGDA